MEDLSEVLCPEYRNVKIRIKSMIHEMLKSKRDLNDVQENIRREFENACTSIDEYYEYECDYIAQHYMKYCAQLWMTELRNYLKELSAKEMQKLFNEVVNTINQMKTINDIPAVFHNLCYHKLLTKHSRFLQKNKQDGMISQFKLHLLRTVAAYSDSAKVELDLMQALLTVLSTTRDFQDVIRALSLKAFCNREITINDFLQNILQLCESNQDLMDLREITQNLLRQDNYFFESIFHNLYADYAKEVEIHQIECQGNLIVEVIGKNIKLSEVLYEVEQKLSLSRDIVEVRFIVSDVLHADVDLRNEIWHGKNLVVLTKVLGFLKTVNWDVSGENRMSSYANLTETDAEGNGKDGKDGLPGESGGNVFISAESIKESQKIEIISNGGKGGTGQNGANGEDGRDGKGIRESDFRAKFSLGVLEQARRALYMKENINTIQSEAIRYKHIWNSEVIWIEAELPDNGQLIYSYYSPGWLTIAQDFALYKGSLGKPGGWGGDLGFGGEGGFAGEIIIKHPTKSSIEFEIERKSIPGGDGNLGKRGLDGIPGKNGWDMAFLDYAFWFSSVVKGTDECSKLSLSYDKRNKKGIWCPRNKAYASIEYASDLGRAENPSRAERKVRQIFERHHHAKATRKKSISQKAIQDLYADKVSNSFSRDTIDKLRVELQQTNESLEKINTEAQAHQQKEEIRSEAQTKYQTHFEQGKNDSCNVRSFLCKTASAPANPSTDIVQLVETLKTCPFELCRIDIHYDTLIELLLELYHYEGQRLRSFSTYVEHNVVFKQLCSIEAILINKHGFGVLEKVSKNLEAHINDSDFVTAVRNSSTVVASPDREKNLQILNEPQNRGITHHSLGDFYAYFEAKNLNESQCKILTRFVQEDFRIENKGIFERLLKAFILIVGKSLGSNQSSYTEYISNWLGGTNKETNIVGVHENSVDNFNSNDFEFKTVRKYYTTFQSSLKKPGAISRSWKFTKNWLPGTKESEAFRWDDCYNDKNLLKEFLSYLKLHGMSARVFRELMSHAFKINILLYIECGENLFSRVDCHMGSSCDTYVRFLVKNKKFLHLGESKNLIQLQEMLELKAKAYETVLVDVNSYLEKKMSISHCSMQLLDETPDTGIIKKITNFFVPEERQQLAMRLEKMTRIYTMRKLGCLNILFRRFLSEGCRISGRELWIITDAVITWIVEDRHEQLTLFTWLFAAYRQENWLHELVLMQIENHFEQILAQKRALRQCLYKIGNIEILDCFLQKLDDCATQGLTVTLDCIETIFHLLSNISNESVRLLDLALSEWPYALKEKYWTHKLRQLIDDVDVKMLQSLAYYTLCVENLYGITLLEVFFLKLSDKTPSSETLLEILSNFCNESWLLTDSTLDMLTEQDLSGWISEMKQKFSGDDGGDRNIDQLIELIKANGNTSKGILETINIVKDSLQEHFQVKKLKATEIIQWALDFKKSFSGETPNAQKYTQMLTVIDAAILLMIGFRLRDTQKLTILSLLLNQRSTLVQVSTGEGKSIIVVAMTIIKVLIGQKMDCITSSRVLAIRDADIYKKLYDLFGISVSHNASENIEERKDVYSRCQVVYGDLMSFQRDYLIDRFYGKNILGDRSFHNVTVDEVDSMLLDKGNNMLYLSHDLAGMDKLESVYVFIWQWLNRPSMNAEDILFAFNAKAIRQAVLDNLFGLLTREDISKLSPHSNAHEQNEIWECLVQAKIIDWEGKILIHESDVNGLDGKLGDSLNLELKSRLRNHLKAILHREKLIRVPECLKSFVILHLDGWIQSAINAFFMESGRDYTIDIDRNENSRNRYPQIIILDKDTGVDEKNSQWDESLHQFLQLKHGCKLTLQSLKAVFISNVSFFKLYETVCGLTGTLGSKRERDLLQGIHDCDFVTIPLAKPKKFTERLPIICESQNDWVKHICKEAKSIAGSENRSVLIICESINDVRTLYKALGGEAVQNVHTYTRDFQEFDLAQGTRLLDCGEIIIATNLAGRGMDIKITDHLRNAGGLHVCLTYLPSNLRIEQQAFGRAARCGDCGSGRLIIASEKSQIIVLKMNRDNGELHRISSIKAHYETQIQTEENCFRTFSEQYLELNSRLKSKEVPTKAAGILLQSVLDKWTFWLDGHNRSKGHLLLEHNRKKLIDQLNEFISKLNSLACDSVSDWFSWVDGNPIQMVKLAQYLDSDQNNLNEKSKLLAGKAIKKIDSNINRFTKYFASDKKYTDAIRLYRKVIKDEPHFCEAAHYYCAFLLSKLIKWDKRPFEGDSLVNYEIFQKALREANRLFDERQLFAQYANSTVNLLKRNDHNMIPIDAFEKQQTDIARICKLFQQSIENILGSPVSPEMLRTPLIDGALSDVLFDIFLQRGVLTPPTVHSLGVNSQALEKIATDFMISENILRAFLKGYERQTIQPAVFENALKEAVLLPSREHFWETLINQHILTDELVYVVADIDKLKMYDKTLTSQLENNYPNNCRILAREKLDIRLHAEEAIRGQIWWRSELVGFIGRRKYQLLEHKGFLVENKQARLNRHALEEATFAHFSFITKQDIFGIGMAYTDADYIIGTLEEENVITKILGDSRMSRYELKIPFDKIEDIHFDSCPIYETAVKRVLLKSFAYEITRQKMLRCLTSDKAVIHIDLKTRPHLELLPQLLGFGVAQPVTVAAHDPNYIATVEGILRELLSLVEDEKSKSNTINSIIESLTKWRGQLDVIKTPKLKLRSLFEAYEKHYATSSDQIPIFNLNSLDNVVQLKHSDLMLLINCSIVAGFGFAQFIGGYVLQYISSSFSGLSTPLLMEGLSDLKYAENAFISGKFSWRDYVKCKMITVFSTSVIFLQALYGGAQPQHQQNQARNLGINIENVRQLQEAIPVELFRAVGTRTGQHFKKMWLLKFKGVDRSLAAEQRLRIVCENMISRVIPRIEVAVDEHKLLASLQRTYAIVGEREYVNVVDDITRHLLTEENICDRIVPIIDDIALDIISDTHNSSFKNLVDQLEDSAHIRQLEKLSVATRKIMNDFNSKIEMKNVEFETDMCSRTDAQSVEKPRQSYESETMARCRKLICETVQRQLEQRLVRPVLKRGGKLVNQYVQDVFRQSIESSGFTQLFAEFSKLKLRHRLQLLEQNEIETLTPNSLNSKYNSNMLCLLKKTQKPYVLAAMIRENVPLTVEFIPAVIESVQLLLRDQVKLEAALIFHINGEGVNTQRFSSSRNNASGRTCRFELTLSYGCFQLSKNDKSYQENNQSSGHYVYEILAKTLPELRSFKAVDFRNSLADVVKDFKAIPLYEKQGHHLGRIIERFENTADGSALDDAWEAVENVCRIDLRERAHLTDIQLCEQRSKAMRRALNSINEIVRQFLYDVHKYKYTGDLVSSSAFTATKYSEVFGTNGQIALYPVEMEAQVSCSLFWWQKITFMVIMRCKNACNISTTAPSTCIEFSVALEKTEVSGKILINANPQMPGIEDHLNGILHAYNDITVLSCETTFENIIYKRKPLEDF